MPEERELLTVMEYAAKWKMNSSSVQKMLGLGRLPGVKVGKSWRIPADAIPAPMGEKATILPTDQPTEQPTEEDAKIDQLDKDLVALDKREKLVDRKTAIVAKELRLETTIPWDEYQDKLKELREAEAKVVADREQLKRDKAELSKVDDSLDEVERSLRGSLKVMEGWWKDAGAYALDIVEAVQAIQHEATYDKSNPDAYLTRVGATGSGGQPPEKTQLMGKALQDRWYEVSKVLWKIARLPQPDFHIDIHRSDVGLLDPADYDEEDELEPDTEDSEQFDIEAVEQVVDEEVVSEFAQDTNVDVPAIVKPRKKVKGEE